MYTDWANHYLEKSRSKKHIQDLQVDVTDGVVLADVIEAVSKYSCENFQHSRNRAPVSLSPNLVKLN